jgi:hypothetical protein
LVAVLSYEFWRSELGGSRDIIGRRSMRLGGENVVVLGVMPPGFDFPPGVDVWIPSTYGDVIVGRLHSGLSLSQAATKLKRLGYKPQANASGSSGPLLEPLHSFLLGNRHSLLLTLWGLSFLFLLLACTGAANLLLARGVRRRSEMVVRLALGAGRLQLIRQLLIETLLLATVGAVFALAVAVIAGRLIGIFLPAARGAGSFPMAGLGLIVALVVAATLLCGIAPALHATGGDLNSFLKTGISGITFAPVRPRFLTAHEFLASGQLALAMILLISTGLLVRSMVAHLELPLGLQTQNVFVVESYLEALPDVLAAENQYWREHRPSHQTPENTFKKDQYNAIGAVIDEGIAQSGTFYDEARRSLAALPGVVSVAVMSPPPFGDEAPGDYNIRAESSSGLADEDGFHVQASEGAFSLLGIRLVAGRTFTARDVANAEPYPPSAHPAEQAAIINEKLARDFWPNENPIGKTFLNPPNTTVVGVVSDARFDSRPNIEPTLYLPFIARQDAGGAYDFLVKVRLGMLSEFAAEVNRSLLPLSPDLVPPKIVSLTAAARASLAGLRLAIVLLGCFAVLGTIVAGLGVYATASLMVAARTREIGIRIALGAQRGQIQQLIAWRGLRSAFIAIPAGILGAWLVGLSLSHWLFEVGAADPLTYFASATLLVMLAFAAGFGPVHRAATADPASVLSHDV